MTFLGADTDQLRETASAFERGAASLETLMTTLSGVVGAVDWQGPDADGFRSGFDQLLRQALTTTGRVSQRATALEEEAEEQDEASSNGGGGAGDSSSNPLDSIRRLFDDVLVPGPPDWLDDAAGHGKKFKEQWDEYREKMRRQPDGSGDGKDSTGGKDAGGDSLKKKFLKWAPVIGAIPELKEMYAAMSRGETGLAIGNGFEAMWAVAPNPLIEVGSFINDASPSFTGSDRTLLEQFGEAQGKSIATRAGEQRGMQISDLLGLERGGTASNLMKSSAGMASFAIASGNAITALPNFASGFWNEAHD